MHTFETLDDLPGARRVLVRLDLNSPVEFGRTRDDSSSRGSDSLRELAETGHLDLNAPVEGGQVQDNRRFERHARTVRELAESGHRVVCLAHQGRPGDDTFVSLTQHADILASHVGREVGFVADTYGEYALSAIRELGEGEILLLENVRMCAEELPEEEPAVKAGTEFVRTLAREFDVYVNDAYSSAHRSHASIVGFPLVLPAYAGRVMQAEYEANTAIAKRDFEGQVTLVAGGVKATDVVDVMTNLGEKVDCFLVGGITGQLFLRAAGYPVGYDTDSEMDLFGRQWDESRTLIEDIVDTHGERLLLASDVAYEGEDGERSEIAVPDIEADRSAFFDIGSDTAERFADIVRTSEAVFVKGALGVFEDERFSHGTVTVLDAIADTDCFSVVGGGDTSRAIEMYGLSEDDFSHVSIAGGAYIRALTGAPLVGVEMLERAERQSRSTVPGETGLADGR
jgi:phosphoglycerate kinase